MTIELVPFDAAEYITEPEDQAELLADALASGDRAYIAHALGIVARARGGIGKLAEETGLQRQALYRALSAGAPASTHRTPIGPAHVVRAGTDVTVVTYGSGVTTALTAAERVEGDVEVLDLRTVWPLDRAAVLNSVEKTSRVLMLQEAARSTGAAGLVLSLIAREGFEHLDAPPALHAPADTPVPFAPALEDAYLPSVDSTTHHLEALLAY